ncbi:MAG: glycosyltransferase family 4 protein [Patescibacteria group bacterium]|nr:glycosyltransferase family 4 protein [Patescibacteria group bacterium]
MKICFYLEFYHFLGGVLFKKIGTGLLYSYKNQKVILNSLGIPFTEKWDDSCDILQINTPWLKSLYLIKKAKRQGKPVIIWSHVTAEDIKGVFRFSFILSPIAKKYLTYAYGLADLIFSPSEYTKSLLIAYGIPTGKIIVISNGVDLKKVYQDTGKREPYRKEYNLKFPAIGTVGLAIPRKGIDTFLNLARKFSDKQFIWYGKIYSPIFVKALPKKLPENVRFTGYVEDQNAAFNSLDIFIFPSFEENEGMAILEAASVELPILVRDIPVYNGWLIHGVNCLKAKNEKEFEDYLNQLTNDENLRKKLGENAKILAQEKSTEVLKVKTLSIYKKLLEKAK